MGLAAMGHHKLAGPVTAGHLFWASAGIGRQAQPGENALRKLANHGQSNGGSGHTQPAQQTVTKYPR